MAKRPFKPAHVPTFMPYLIVSDPKKAIAFYEKAFGFEISLPPMEKNGQIIHFEMKHLDAVIMGGPHGVMGGITYKSPKQLNVRCSVGLYLYTQDVDGLFNRAVEGGAVVERKPKDQFYGDRNFTVTDPDGYSWTFAQNVADFDPSKTP